jgi:iron complex outermembrane receptor protein
MNKTKNIISLEMILFKRWSRKSFSIFMGLNKIIKIGFLSVIISFVISIPKGYSQPDTIKTENHIDINEVVITGERTPQVYSKISRIVTTIPQKETKHLPVQNIIDILEYTPATDLRVRGKYGIQADLSIRGGSFDQNIILLNGINISNPQSGHLSLNLPIDIESIQQIEVLEGTSSRISGANAFSGAINFVTKTDTINNVSFHAMYGEHNLFKTNVTASLSNKHIKNFIAFTKYKSDGFTHNTDFNTYSLYYNGKINTETGKVCFQLGLNDKAYGSNSFYGSKYKDQFEENSSYLTSISFETGSTVKLRTSAYWRRVYDHFVLIRNTPKIYQNFHVTDVIGTKLNGSFSSIIGETNIGVDFRNESIHSNNLGHPTNDSILVRKEDSIYYNKFHSRTNTGIFIEQSYHYNKFNVSGGGVFNFNTDQGLSGKFYPGIDAGYQLQKFTKIYIAVNSAVRMPTFTDLFFQGRENIGNPNLKPEESITYETGIKYSSYIIGGNASLFFRQGKNIIDWNKQNENDTYWIPSNITMLNTLGVELNSNINTSSFALNSIYGIRSVGFGFLYLNVTKSSSNTISRYALDHLNLKITSSIDIKLFKNIYSNWQFVYQDRNGDYQIYNTDNNSYETQTYNPFYLIDMKVYLEHKIFNPYFEISNIFDVEYNDIGGVPQPGRWIRCGVKIDLAFSN